METMGPGWARKDGYIVGYAFAVDGWRGYFPVAHEGGGNIDKRLVENFVRRTLELPNAKVMHNAAYDLGWLLSSGFKVNGRIIDTMIAAPLIDENRFSFSLNALGFDYLKEVKSEMGLKEAAGDFNVHAKKELWKLPAMFVGEYAVQDEAYVTVQPGVGSRVTRRVKASEVHKLREPGQQRARSEEELVHLLTPVASGVPSGGGGGSP